MNLIEQYAKLSLAAERCAAKGLPIPDNVIRGMQGIEASARSRLTPGQFQDAMLHVNTAKRMLIAEETETLHAKNEQEKKKGIDSLSRNITRGFLGESNGLDAKQMADLLRKGKVTLKAKGPKFDRDSLEEQTRKQTKKLDPNGKGYSLKEWEKRLDELADASPEHFASLAKGYKADPNELQDAANRWKSDRYQYELNKRQAASDDSNEDETVEVSDDVIRSAELRAAVVEDESVDSGWLAGDVSQDLLEEDSRHGDLARAFVENEEQEESHA